jgi:hypothetical protein
MLNSTTSLFLRSAVVMGALVASAMVPAAVVPANAAKAAYVGNWSTTGKRCDPELGVIELKARSLVTVDAECKFTSVTGGSGVWKVRAKCVGEGGRNTQRFTMWANATRLTLKYSADPRRFNYARCRS